MMLSSLTDVYNIFLQHPQIVTDSRSISPSCIFFALRGERFNGNQYALEALEKGASWVVIDEPEHKLNARCLLVDNVLRTLQDLAKRHRNRFNIPLIGITGTNGKTTTKELIHSVLSSTFNVVSTQGNLNNHIGVPLTLLKLGSDTRIAVVEMGANHPGEIDFLCDIARPNYGIITNTGRAHLEGFGSFEGVVSTKTELYRFLSSSMGKVFVNSEDSILMCHSADLDRITYGFGDSAQMKAVYDSSSEILNVNITPPGGNSFSIHSRLFGDYNALNILAAACIGNYFSISNENIKQAVESYLPSNNRSQLKKSGKNLLLLDAYNANPSSMESALRYFASSSYDDKVIILGDMLELGAESENLHIHILKLIEELSFAEVYLVGPVFTRVNTKREFLCFNDSELARLWFSHHILSGKTVLLKGSRGIKLETIEDTL